MSETRIGRPPLPPEERRSERVWIWITVHEADLVMAAAVRAGLSVSEYLRRRLGLPRYGKDSAA